MSNPAEMYERFLVPAMFAPLIPRLIDVARPQSGERILDVACGTGIVARRFTERIEGTRTTGVDMNPLMLGVARTRAAQEGVTVEWRECRAEELPFSDASFDLVTCQHGLQFVPDRSEALSEMHRVLDEGGRAVAVTWRGLDQHPFFAELDRACSRQIGAGATDEPFSLGDADQLADMFISAGFSDIEAHPFSFTASYASPEIAVSLILRSATAALPRMSELTTDEIDGLIEAVQDDMAKTIRDHTAGDRLEIPLKALVTLGHKPARS